MTPIPLGTPGAASIARGAVGDPAGTPSTRTSFSPGAIPPTDAAIAAVDPTSDANAASRHGRGDRAVRDA
ncbi:MAG: hypothetical protein ACYTFH_06845, partial [Planctomycetota bacterium]